MRSMISAGSLPPGVLFLRATGQGAKVLKRKALRDRRRNAHLGWAFGEAALLQVRGNKGGEKYYNRLISRHGKGKALTIVAKRLGVAVYYMLKRRDPFNEHKFLGVSPKGRCRQPDV